MANAADRAILQDQYASDRAKQRMRDELICDIHEWMEEAHGAWVEMQAAAENLRSLDAELMEAGFGKTSGGDR